MNTMFCCLLMIVGVFINSVSQMMLKKSALKTYPSKIREYLNPLVIGAYIISTGVTLLFSYTYKGIPLSLGPVLEASGYLFVTFWGLTLFGEKLNKKKIMALGLIIVGIVISSVF